MKKARSFFTLFFLTLFCLGNSVWTLAGSINNYTERPWERYKTVVPISTVFAVNESVSMPTPPPPPPPAIEIVKTSFEATGDTWTFSVNPAMYSVGSDIWNPSAAINIISPNDGSLFWGMRDLNNSNGGGNFDHTITFDAFDISGYENVVLTFDYFSFSFDGPDYIRYAIEYDNGTTFTNNANQGLKN